jgi:hypothetical protein
MLVKLDSIHLLMEWQFQNPQRLRTIMKNDDETALWVSLHYLSTRLSDHVHLLAYICDCAELFPQRIEPIGYDGKRNAYWLIGGKSIVAELAALAFVLTCELHQRIACGYNVHCQSSPRTASENDPLLAMPVIAKVDEPLVNLLPRNRRSTLLPPTMTL